MSSRFLFSRLPYSFDLKSLRKDLEKLNSCDWMDHVNKREYSGCWQVLPLRCLAVHENSHPILQGFALEAEPAENHWKNLPVLEQCPAFKSVLQVLQCRIESMRLMRLNANASILPHQDGGLAIEYGQARLHLPIEMDAGLEFVVNNTAVPMSVGELWYINADQTHSVVNKGRHARVNMVIDCQVNDWLFNMIRAGDHSASL